MKIAVAGTGYVGLSLAVLLSQHNEVTAVDVIPEKVDKINQRVSPIQDEYIEKYLAEKDLNLVATLDGAKAYKNAELVIIAAPTNYDSKKNFFDTKYVEQVINRRFPSVTRKACEKSIIQKILFSVPNFCENPRLYTTIFIRAGLSSVARKETRKSKRWRINLPNCCSKAR